MGYISSTQLERVASVRPCSPPARTRVRVGRSNHLPPRVVISNICSSSESVTTCTREKSGHTSARYGAVIGASIQGLRPHRTRPSTMQVEARVSIPSPDPPVHGDGRLADRPYPRTSTARARASGAAPGARARGTTRRPAARLTARGPGRNDSLASRSPVFTTARYPSRCRRTTAASAVADTDEVADSMMMAAPASRMSAVALWCTRSSTRCRAVRRRADRALRRRRMSTGMTPRSACTIGCPSSSATCDDRVRSGIEIPPAAPGRCPARAGSAMHRLRNRSRYSRPHTWVIAWKIFDGGRHGQARLCHAGRTGARCGEPA